MKYPKYIKCLDHEVAAKVNYISKEEDGSTVLEVKWTSNAACGHSETVFWPDSQQEGCVEITEKEYLLYAVLDS